MKFEYYYKQHDSFWDFAKEKYWRVSPYLEQLLYIWRPCAE